MIPEHVQNTAFGNPTPGFRVPWEAHPGLGSAGLLYAIGGRSLAWGGWSPELLHEGAKGDEMAGWPGTVATELKLDREFVWDYRGPADPAINDRCHSGADDRTSPGHLSALRTGRRLSDDVHLQ